MNETEELHGMHMDKDVTVNIVGAGLAGLSAAIHLAMAGVKSRLISSQPSERAQSVLAEGGINGALNTMGEDDCTENHFHDTMKAGCDIADPEAVRDLTEHAPDVLRWLDNIGVPFQRKGDVIQQRNFGGQKKKRTAYAESSTGKVLMTALIDEARKYEAAGLIVRLCHHDFVKLILAEHQSLEDVRESAESAASAKSGGCICTGVVIRDNITGEEQYLYGPVLMAAGGLNGLFPGRTTGTTANTGDAAAKLFSQGVAFSNLEMIQYHPTTLAIPDKRLLVSEAARGEGGRLFIMRGKEKWYFMEEKYPELGNLMPRDVVSREEYFVMHDPSCGGQVFLDCTGLSREIWTKRLPDLRREVKYYTDLDPAKQPIPVEPGIHYFMGGIDTDAAHRTNIAGLYAAGECCSLYHGANRLGGNSTLGAIFGGQRAAVTIAADKNIYSGWRTEPDGLEKDAMKGPEDNAGSAGTAWASTEAAVDKAAQARKDEDEKLGSILYDALGVVRTASELAEAEENLRDMLKEAGSSREKERILLGLAILGSAQYRKESRGAQYRSDYPERSEDYKGAVVVRYEEEVGNRFYFHSV